MPSMMRLRHLLSNGLLFSVPFVYPTDPARAQGSERHEMVRIGAFQIDVHEVTVAQFRAFVAATALSTKAEREGGGFQYVGGWQRMPGWTWSHPYGRPAADNEPAVHLTWDEARAYCAWAGLRLPTDIEWRSAAYTERRDNPPAPFKSGQTYIYPSGTSPDGANQMARKDALPRAAPEGALDRGHGHVRVRATPPGVNGLYDMGGNVWEWVDHDVGGSKRTRGGSWWYGPAQMKADALYEKDRGFPAVYIGFRCARDG